MLQVCSLSVTCSDDRFENGFAHIFDSPVAMQNRDAFQGTEILAKQLTTKNLLVASGKQVVVIGSAKSALDVAGAAGEVADSVTMLCRQVTLCILCVH